MKAHDDFSCKARECRTNMFQHCEPHVAPLYSGRHSKVQPTCLKPLHMLVATRQELRHRLAAVSQECDYNVMTWEPAVVNAQGGGRNDDLIVHGEGLHERPQRTARAKHLSHLALCSKFWVAFCVCCCLGCKQACRAHASGLCCWLLDCMTDI